METVVTLKHGGFAMAVMLTMHLSDADHAFGDADLQREVLKKQLQHQGCVFVS